VRPTREYHRSHHNFQSGNNDKREKSGTHRRTSRPEGHVFGGRSGRHARAQAGSQAQRTVAEKRTKGGQLVSHECAPDLASLPRVCSRLVGGNSARDYGRGRGGTAARVVYHSKGPSSQVESKVCSTHISCFSHNANRATSTSWIPTPLGLKFGPPHS
jgi:hypothetical protein